MECVILMSPILFPKIVFLCRISLQHQHQVQKSTSKRNKSIHKRISNWVKTVVMDIDDLLSVSENLPRRLISYLNYLTLYLIFSTKNYLNY